MSRSITNTERAISHLEETIRRLKQIILREIDVKESEINALKIIQLAADIAWHQRRLSWLKSASKEII